MSDNKELFLSTLNQMNKLAADEMKQLNESFLTNFQLSLESHKDVEKVSQQNHERRMQEISSNHVKNVAALDGARSKMNSDHETNMLAINSNTTAELRAIENARNNNATGSLIGLVTNVLGGGGAKMSILGKDVIAKK